MVDNLGLPVAGYKPTQPQTAINAVNEFKYLEERVLRHIDALEGHGAAGVFSDADKRLLAIGRTQLQGAFMFLARAVFQPGRVTLPEDVHEAAAIAAEDEHLQSANEMPDDL